MKPFASWLEFLNKARTMGKIAMIAPMCFLEYIEISSLGKPPPRHPLSRTGEGFCVNRVPALKELLGRPGLMELSLKFQEILKRSLFRNLARIQNNDPIHAFNGREPVSDRDNGFSP